MAKTLTREDIDEKFREQIYVQDYSPKAKIEGVKIIPINNFVGEDVDFSELIRITGGKIEGLEDFEVLQVNRSRLFSGGVKAWHVHFNQEDIWYLPPSSALFVGLWDLRRDSETKDVKMKLTLGMGSSSLLYIPRGVAHGMHNVSKRPIDLFYFVNQQFDASSPDEQRLPWDAAGEDFWTPVKE
jgi:dTDP-4-dehydrorhamnose 3,5-epimerase